MESACFRDDAFSADLFRSFLRRHPRGLWIAEVRREPAGYLMLHAARGIGRIDSVAVLPRFRRRGIGRTLIEFALDSFRRARVPVCALEVRPSNRRATRLYRTLGFEVTRLLPGYYSDGEAAWHMQLPLAP